MADTERLERNGDHVTVVNGMTFDELAAGLRTLSRISKLSRRKQARSARWPPSAMFCLRKNAQRIELWS